MTEPLRNRGDYGYFSEQHTRWEDNDIFQHVNNVAYYSFFDTAINEFLINRGQFDPFTTDIVGFIVHSHCDFFAPLRHPSQFQVGVRTNHLGNSSVRYGVAVFPAAADMAIAVGEMTHVFVSRDNETATPIPEAIRAALAANQ